MSDAFILKKISFTLSELLDELNAQQGNLKWLDNQESGKNHQFANNGRYHTGKHGTKWCYFTVSVKMVEKIERDVGCRIFREVFYLWDYGQNVKVLPIHIDTAEINQGKAIAACIPLKGRFHIKFYSDFAKTRPIDECIYGPGDLILINNRKYFHEGIVIDETRLGLHFFLDFENFDPNETLEDLVYRNQIIKYK